MKFLQYLSKNPMNWTLTIICAIFVGIGFWKGQHDSVVKYTTIFLGTFLFVLNLILSYKRFRDIKEDEDN